MRNSFIDAVERISANEEHEIETELYMLLFIQVYEEQTIHWNSYIKKIIKLQSVRIFHGHYIFFQVR